MRMVTTALTAMLGLTLVASGALAQLNCQQVRLIVPYPAGGAADVAGRLVAERFEATLKRPMVVENRAGATGNIGTVAVATAPADGCTLLINAAVIATFTSSFTKLGYDPIKDLVPVGGVGVTPTMLVTAAANPPNDLAGLIAWARSKPDGLNYSTAGYGLLQHLAVEDLASRTGTKLVHVAYKGGAQAVTDLLAARVDLGSFAAGSVLPLVREGKLKALAVVARKRSELMPDVPTTAEQGFSGLDAGVHFMLYAPAATPKETVALLSAELRKLVGDGALKERFIRIGYDPTPSSSEDMIAVMKKTQDDWSPLIKTLNIKLD